MSDRLFAVTVRWIFAYLMCAVFSHHFAMIQIVKHLCINLNTFELLVNYQHFKTRTALRITLCRFIHIHPNQTELWVVLFFIAYHRAKSSIISSSESNRDQNAKDYTISFVLFDTIVSVHLTLNAFKRNTWNNYFYLFF